LSEFPTIAPAPPSSGKSDGPFQQGQVFGRYRIEKILGSGGMGHVYKAWDEELGEAVALKVVRGEYAASSDAAVRFKRELHLARQVTHKNVVRIYDLGEMDGIKYISMPFIDGLDLATMIKNGKIPLQLAVSLARQIAAGLGAAHEAGIVHRDLKPANIMVNRAGQAILMDFGLARSTEATAYTAAGAVLGTLEYMSPEQARGETASHRSDIYTLGLIYYELFTGDRPFTGDTPMSRLAERVNKPAPDPRTNHPDLPPRIAAIIQRCLERDPTLRYASTTEIEAAFDPARLTAQEATPAPAPAPSSAGDGTPAEFPIGTVLAGRYQLIKTLGHGGMGVVYQAFDRQLTRVVALKTILPDLAASPTVLKRFKQEVRLAQKVNHKNVVRIFDMGEDGATKFITMDFIDGVDLKEIITRRGKLPPVEAVGIIRQVCGALEAAHTEDVTHRDLKPQNIMVQEDGQIVVMDFGIARSQQSQSGTQTDAIVGTPEYMSPEQARSEEVDARSDIFSLGLIFYELLTGKVPFRADSPVATMFKRTQERAAPPVELDSSIPKAANDIVVKCLETDRERRYQKVADILADLEAFDPSKKVGAGERAKIHAKKASRYWKWAAAAVVVVFAVAGGVLLRDWFAPSVAAPHAPMTVLIADFSNHTGDTVFDGTLEPIVRLGLNGASFINAYDRTGLRRDLGVKPTSTEDAKLDDAKAQDIAAGQGLNVVVSGSLDRRGAEYKMSMRATQVVTGKVLANAEETAPSKDQVLFGVSKLATTVRKLLGDSTSDSDQRLSMETLSAASLEAVHEYAAALDALSAGNYPESKKRATQAVELDPNFGMAYSVLASVSSTMGFLQDAEKYARESIKYTGRMTERERYRARAYLYLVTGDQQKCVDEYSALLEKYPSDTGAYTNVGSCYLHLHNIPKALDAERRAVAILPKRAIYHANLSYFSAYTGDFQTAAKEAAEAEKLGYALGLVFDAYVALARGPVGEVADAADAYHKFEKTNLSDATTGLADLAIYQGQFKEAVSILEKGASTDMASQKPSPDSASTKYWMLAYVRFLQGQKEPSLAAAKRALELSKSVPARFMAARVYLAFGEAAKAKELAAGLASELEIEPQAYAKLISGEVALQAGDAKGAVDLFKGGNDLLDTWIGRYDLGRAYLELGLFTQADSEFDRCIQRRGEVLALFLDLPTYGLFPSVYYYQGRVREAGKIAGFSDSYKNYLAIRGKAGEDPLLADVRKRAGQ
jgi:serine/threonine protein kinase/tetratricopeptide (TPR) repeat protein